MVQYGLQPFPKGNSSQKLKLQDLCLRDGSTSKDLQRPSHPREEQGSSPTSATSERDPLCLPRSPSAKIVLETKGNFTW